MEQHPKKGTLPMSTLRSALLMLLTATSAFAGWSVGDSITWEYSPGYSPGAMETNSVVSRMHVSSIRRSGDTTHYEFTVDSSYLTVYWGPVLLRPLKGEVVRTATTTRRPAGVRVWSDDLLQCSWIVPDSDGIFFSESRFPLPVLVNPSWDNGMPLYDLRVNDTFGIRCTAFLDRDVHGDNFGEPGAKAARVRYANRQDTIGTVMTFPKGFQESDGFWRRSPQNPFGIGTTYLSYYDQFADSGESRVEYSRFSSHLSNYVPAKAALGTRPVARNQARAQGIHDALGRPVAQGHGSSRPRLQATADPDRVRIAP